MILTSSCTYKLLSSGTNPWAFESHTSDEIERELGSPLKNSLLTDENKTALAEKCRSWFDQDTLRRAAFYETRELSGPFVADTVDQLEASNWAIITLGLAEIYMYPRTLIKRRAQRKETRGYLFLYDTNNLAINFIETDRFMMTAEQGNREGRGKGTKTFD